MIIMNNKLTRKDIEEMQAEIDHRKLVLRPELLEEVKETRAQGDLSENFEYHVARIIEDDTAENEAGINKKVTIYIPEDDEEETYTIVSTMRQNSLKGLISVESPLGKALLHRKEGDSVMVQVSPDYSYKAVIRKVEESEDAETASLRNY